LITEFRKMRIEYLMSLDFDELDKLGFLEELQTKYLQGFQQKWFARYGKHHKSFTETGSTAVKQKEIDALIQFAIDNKDITAELGTMWKKNFKDDPDKLLQLVKEAPQKRIDQLMNLSWENLDTNNLLEELKRKYLEGYKIKYHQKFGIEYKE